MDESYIERGTASTSFVGPDATKLFAATAVRAAIDLYLKTGLKANRAYTPTNMLRFASNLTGKSYKRGRAGLAQASSDIKLWCDEMAAALPKVER